MELGYLGSTVAWEQPNFNEKKEVPSLNSDPSFSLCDNPSFEGLLSRYRLARGAFASFCRSWLQWCAYGAPARLADSTSWISCFATTRWSVVTLDPGKKTDEQPLLLLVFDTRIEGASLSHARQE